MPPIVVPRHRSAARSPSPRRPGTVGSAPQRAVGPCVAAPELGPTSAVASVELQVRSVDRSILFWRHVVGLRILDEARGVATLGVADRPLVVLRAGATTAALPGRAGLDRLALRLPDARELGRVLARLLASRVPFRTVDDGRAKAILLEDPDGLGLALTLGAPAAGVALVAAGVPAPDAGGPLDIAAQLDLVGDEDLRRHLPAETVVGRVRLAAGGLRTSAAFYDRLDLAEAGASEGRAPATDREAPAAPVAPERTARLLRITVDHDRLDAVLGRLPAAEPTDGGHLVRDPDGTEVLLTADRADAL